MLINSLKMRGYAAAPTSSCYPRLVVLAFCTLLILLFPSLYLL